MSNHFYLAKKITAALLSLLIIATTSFWPIAVSTVQAQEATDPDTLMAQDQKTLNEARQADEDTEACLSAYQYSAPSDPAEAASQAAGDTPKEGGAGSANAPQSVNDASKIDPKNNFKTSKNWDDFQNINDVASYVESNYGAKDISSLLKNIEKTGGSIEKLKTDFSSLNVFVSKVNKVGNIEDFSKIVGNLKDIGGSYESIASDFGNFSTFLDKAGTTFKGKIGDLSQVIGSVKEIGGNLSQLISGFGSLDGAMSSLSNLTNINLASLSGVFSGVGQMGGDLSQLISGFGGTAQGLLSQIGNLSSLSDVSGIMNSLGNLGGNFSQLVSGFGNIQGLFNSLGNISNLGDVSSVLNGLSNLGGSLSSLTSGFGSIQGMISGLSNFADLGGLSNLLGTISGAGGNLTQLISGFGSVQGLLGGLSSMASGIGGLSSLAGTIGTLSSSLAGGFPALIASAGSMSGLLSGLGGLAGGIMGGGAQYVPVHETGQLLTNSTQILSMTQSTDSNTGQSRDTLIKLCVHLKAIKRMQYAFETKAFVGDPDVRRRASGDIETYKQELFNYIHTGYQSPAGIADAQAGESTGAPQGNAPLYVENINSHLKEITDEQATVLNDDINNIKGTILADPLAQAQKTLAYSQAETFAEKFKSTIPQDLYEAFTTNPTTMSSADWWGAFLGTKEIDSPNNPGTAYMLLSSELQRRQVNAEQNAREQILAGQGFLPNQICTEKTSDGSGCRTWKIISPGVINSQTLGEAINSRLSQYETADSLGDLSSGLTPQTMEAADIKPGEASSPYNPEPSSSSNTTKKTPTVKLKYVVSTTDTTSPTPKKSSTLTWSSTGADECQASNDWFNSTGIAKSKDTNLGHTSGQFLLTMPLQASLTIKWVKKTEPFVSYLLGSTIRPATDNSFTLEKLISLPSTFSVGDSFFLESSDGAILKILIDQDTSLSTLIMNIANALKNSSNTSLNRLTVNPMTLEPGGDSTLVARLEPVYEVTCSNSGGKSSKQVVVIP